MASQGVAAGKMPREKVCCLRRRSKVARASRNGTMPNGPGQANEWYANELETKNQQQPGA